MGLHLVQLRTRDGNRAVAVAEGGVGRILVDVQTTLELALKAIGERQSLEAVVARCARGEDVDLHAARAEGRILAPIDHPDPAHMTVTGTGLTHLGSAEGRDKMHKKLTDESALTDSMRMFKLGLEGGRPEPGQVGAQPEWFYKGDGSVIAPPEGPLLSPGFAEDGGEEPEIVGVYVIGPDGSPYRVGFALGNEFSDHVVERQNYLWLAHSKLRQCSFGPELVTGPLPAEVKGVSRIRRGNEVIWEKPFLSGEAHMSHSLANLEHHHFKYGLFRRPGDVHIHYFGTATLSFSDGVQTQTGDIFEIEAEPFGMPLSNTLAQDADDQMVKVEAL